MSLMDTLSKVDPEIAKEIDCELNRQRNKLELIASENIVSQAVLTAQGSVLTNKYAEGYPGKRYYGGCEYVDVVEQLAIDRAKKLFGAEYANVQPHSGAQANMAVFFALLQPGDTVMAIGQIFAGPISDMKGRRLPLIVGMGIFALSSLVCVFAKSITLFLVFRFIQGLAGAAGIVIARAIARDICEGPQLTKFFSMMSTPNFAVKLRAICSGRVVPPMIT